MSEEIENINFECSYNSENVDYYSYEKLRFSKIVGMKITGAIWSRWDSLICLKNSKGKKYVLYIFHNGDTGEPDFKLFSENDNLECFKNPICWRKKSYKKWVKKVKKHIEEFEKELESGKK